MYLILVFSSKEIKIVLFLKAVTLTSKYLKDINFYIKQYNI